jgi:hypothetical protein
MKSSNLAYIFYFPYLAVLSWNIFVAQYGMKHYGFAKLDPLWAVASLGFLAVGIIILARSKVYVLHKKHFDEVN